MSYISEVKTEKNYVGNVVILFNGVYFAVRQPDSGLSISMPYAKSVASLLLNPTTIDIRRVSTTISSFSFRIIDKEEIITALVLGDAMNLINAEVRIFLGHSNLTGNPSLNMPFADYFELPRTYIRKCDFSDGAYNFSTTEQTERMAKPIFHFSSALDVNILSGTTTWTMREDISSFPTSGFLKCEDEIVSYSGIDVPNNRFTGVIRGELSSIPVAHAAGSECFLYEAVTDNPLNIILKILISGGGGGTYDTLQDGLGISNTLIDITGIEALRDELFLGEQYTLEIYNVDSALKLIEDELLMPNGLRFTYALNSKLTLAILDKARFVEESDIINHDTITKFPKWSIDGNKVTNAIEVKWDYSEGTGQFNKTSPYEDAPSIALYGRQTPLKFQFKGPKAALGGQALVDDFGRRLLDRLSTPTPDISINTQIDKSLQTIGDKAYLVSSKIPAADGTLNFASDLEIVSRSINHKTGDVSFKLAFTSFTNFRSGYIAPSDTFTTILAQNKINVGAGRAAFYSVGWVMRLWDNVANAYLSDAPNVIVAIDVANDEITFQNNWTTTLVANTHKMRFADYDDVVASQKRYCFVSNLGNDFPDGKPTYKVTY